MNNRAGDVFLGGLLLMRILRIREYAGPNIYNKYFPVISVLLDLEEMRGIWSCDVPGFNKKLLQVLPQLEEHYCSRGYRGGFVERLKEGTLFGHIVEHVAIELQNQVGCCVNYGKTQGHKNSSVYKLVIEVKTSETGTAAVYSAVKLVENLIKGEKVEIHKIIEKLKKIEADYGLGPSMAALIKECRKRDIPVMSLGFGSLYQLGYGKEQKRIKATLTNYTSCIGVDIASNKELTKGLLRFCGIPVPWGKVVTKEQDTLQVAEEMKGPVAIKPYNGNHGKGVSLNLKSEKEIKRAFHLAQYYSEDVIVEKYFPGKHYRLLVVNNKVVAAAERFPAHVMGDGIHSIEELVAKVNEDLLRGEGHEKPLTKIKLDSQALFVLARNNLQAASIPKKDSIVYVRDNCNLSTGGTAVDVTDKVHSSINSIAVRSAELVGLDVAGIDIVCPDISQPLGQQGAVIEVNAAPGIRMHMPPFSIQGNRVAEEIIKYLFPREKGRIPIFSITGTNGKTTTARFIAYILKKWGKCVGLATTGGIFVDDECLMQGDTTGPQSAKVVLQDSRVDMAVLETARGGILRSGLGYDKAAVGIITNISEDHLGLNGIEKLEEMAQVKSLVIEALEQGGTAILNADDIWCVKSARYIRENLIYFSVKGDNLVIKRHLATGQKAVFIRQNKLIIAEGESYRSIIDLKDIPLAIQGLAQFNIANTLAAVAGCIAIGVPDKFIKAGLKTFGLDRKHNPGRCQFYERQGVKIILDYGHNPHAFENVLSFAKRLQPQRMIGVIGVPGDRRDQDIVRAGFVAGKYLDYCFIKEDRDLRGRAPGETAALLAKGLRQQRFDVMKQEVIMNEVTATVAAMSKCKPGDLLIIFYEKLAPLQALLDEVSNKSPEIEGKPLQGKGRTYSELQKSIGNE